ncbi:MAG: hypothetical protein GEU68_00580, partial [Actinobacteria bacterium]|nr:hypothetical protein [Actinomycetota bacterium]
MASQAAVVGTGAEVNVFGFAYLSFPAVGLLIVSRQPRNAIGWVLVVTGNLLAVVNQPMKTRDLISLVASIDHKENRCQSGRA